MRMALTVYSEKTDRLFYEVLQRLGFPVFIQLNSAAKLVVYILVYLSHFSIYMKRSSGPGFIIFM